MSIHPVLADKLNAALGPLTQAPLTRRDARLPSLPGKVHAVIGMRRAGKTSFLYQLLAERRLTAPDERALYISFDDDRLAELGVDQLDALIEEYYRRYPQFRGRERVLWLFDEIQLVAGWERFVRRLLDTENVEIVVSGSSAKMLSREVHTSLRGRGIETVIRPFSFRESLRHRQEEPDAEPKRWTAAQRSLIEKRFREFLVDGGFPETHGLDAALRVDVLQGYVDTVLFRDIVERFAITQVSALRWLVRQCLRNPATSVSVHRLHQDLKSQGLGIGKDAVHELFGHLQDAFLISAVPLATESERQRNSNPRKVYPVDPGLIKAFDTSGRANVGHALETVVLNELERRGADVTYVKTAGSFEVDMLARHRDGAQELVQVCADLSDVDTRTREQRALTAATKDYPRAKARILTLERDLSNASPSSDMGIQPVYEWLLETA